MSVRSHDWEPDGGAGSVSPSPCPSARHAERKGKGRGENGLRIDNLAPNRGSAGACPAEASRTTSTNCGAAALFSQRSLRKSVVAYRGRNDNMFSTCAARGDEACSRAIYRPFFQTKPSDEAERRCPHISTDCAESEAEDAMGETVSEPRGVWVREWSASQGGRPFLPLICVICGYPRTSVFPLSCRECKGISRS